MSKTTAIFALLLCLPAARRSSAEEPLNVAIDRIIAAGAGGDTLAPASDDAEFLRRASLDLAGCIPSASDARQFLADASADKRARLIDKLLASPAHAQRLEDFFNVLLMERRGSNPEWSKFLRSSAAANKPWDQLVREILDPKPDDESRRGAAYFFTKRLEAEGQQAVDHPGLTRDVGRLFLGLDLQCAQCHNHLTIDDYKQQDFQGLLAAYQGVSIRGDAKFPAIAEKPLPGKLEFISVFASDKHATAARIPGGKEFEGNPAAPAPGPVAFLASEISKADNPQFARNIANRIWCSMLGRGLVHPLDLHHSANPPSHPELLDLMSKEIAAHKFDLRWLLREIALSQTYQRSSRLPAGQAAPAPEKFLVAREKRLSGEQLWRSALQATGASTSLPPDPSASAAQPVDPALVESQKAFVEAFANPPREPEDEYAASVKGALFLLNDDRVFQLLQPRAGNLVERAAAMSDPAAVAEELYMSVLSRRPTDSEAAEVTEYLSKNNERRAIAIGHLAWALLASVEFSVNH